jgi:hypothetical protein
VTTREDFTRPLQTAADELSVSGFVAFSNQVLARYRYFPDLSIYAADLASRKNYVGYAITLMRRLHVLRPDREDSIEKLVMLLGGRRGSFYLATAKNLIRNLYCMNPANALVHRSPVHFPYARFLQGMPVEFYRNLLIYDPGNARKISLLAKHHHGVDPKQDRLAVCHRMLRYTARLNRDHWLDRFNCATWIGVLAPSVPDIRRFVILAPGSGDIVEIPRRIALRRTEVMHATLTRWAEMLKPVPDPATLTRHTTNDVLQVLRRMMKKSGDTATTTDIWVLTGALYLGRIELVYFVTRKLLRSWVLGENQRLRLSIIHLVCVLYLQFMDRETPPKGRRPKLVVQVGVWGREYAELWLEFGARSLLSPLNRGLFDSFEVMVLVTTDAEAEAIIRSHSMLSELSKKATVTFLDFAPGESQKGIAASHAVRQTAGEWVGAIAARGIGAGLIPLSADFVFADGTFIELVKAVSDNGKNIIFHGVFEVRKEFEDRIASDKFGENTTLTLSNAKELIELGMSSQILNSKMDVDGRKQIPVLPKFFVFEDARRLTIHLMHPAPLFFSHATLIKMTVPRFVTFDGQIDWIMASEDIFAGDFTKVALLNDTESAITLSMAQKEFPMGSPFDVDDETEARHAQRVALKCVNFQYGGLPRLWCLKHAFPIRGKNAEGWRSSTNFVNRVIEEIIPGDVERRVEIDIVKHMALRKLFDDRQVQENEIQP